MNQWTRAHYDNMRQLDSTTDARGNTTYYDWCSCGALASVIDPLNNTTLYARDNVGSVTNIRKR